ncbi:MAG: hypothetical protein PVH61_00130 [Candidatus Aminicenantes bacterium]
MFIKQKILASMVMPLLLLAFSSCDDDRTFSDKYIFKKSTEKKTVALGEPFDIKLSLTNRSIQNVEFYELKKELKQHDFAVIGDNVFRGYELRNYGRQAVIYKLLPLSLGKKRIGPSKVTKVKFYSYDRIYPVAGNTGFSNALRISVKPIELEVSMSLSKAEILLGDKLSFDVLIINNSVVDIEGIELLFDGNPDDVNHLETDTDFKTFSIPAGKSKKIQFVYKAKEVKNVELYRCFIKKFKTSGRWIPLDESYRSKPAPKITVIPISFEVSQHYGKTKVNLGDEIPLDLKIKNTSNILIKDLIVQFKDDCGKLKKERPGEPSKLNSVPPGQTRTISYVCRAVEAGNLTPGKAIIKSVQVGNSWLHLEKGYARSLPGPEIDIAPLLLPGIKAPMSNLTKNLEEYFSPKFILRTLCIAFALLFANWLFCLLVQSFLVDYITGRIILGFFIVAVLGTASILSINGLLWIFKVLLPGYWMIIAVFLGCCCLVFIFQTIFTKNMLYGIIISGLGLTTVSYVLYVGFMAYKHMDFKTFPYTETAILGFGIGLGLNLFFMRKEIRRKIS